MIPLATGMAVGCWGPVYATVTGQSAAVAPEDGGNDAGLPAWIRFEKMDKTYAQIPYLWPGDVNINLKINVKPSPKHILQLRWGVKNDDRQAVVTINGEDVTVAHGGYDGFEWVRVPRPPTTGPHSPRRNLARDCLK